MKSEYYNWWQKRKEILNNAREFVREIKKFCIKEIDQNCRVILFGSIARGNYRVDSDVDVLIITDKAKTAWDKAVIAAKIHEMLGFGDPIELHIVTNEEYENWYKKFIDVCEEF